MVDAFADRLEAGWTANTNWRANTKPVAKELSECKPPREHEREKIKGPAAFAVAKVQKVRTRHFRGSVRTRSWVGGQVAVWGRW